METAVMADLHGFHGFSRKMAGKKEPQNGTSLNFPTESLPTWNMVVYLTTLSQQLRLCSVE
jgi:hypothetical protein